MNNFKIAIAKRYGAMIVREELTFLAVPTDDPAYRGRTFNRMINDGSRGQYTRRSDEKARWVWRDIAGEYARHRTSERG